MSDRYDSTGWYHQNGWRRDCTGKWHPPDRTPGPGWWIADDGVWYPPDRSPEPGWWLASDGNWYPPNGSVGPEATAGSDSGPAWGLISVVAAVAGVGLSWLALSAGLSCGDEPCPSALINTVWVAIGAGLVLEVVALSAGLMGRGGRGGALDRRRARTGLWISLITLGLLALALLFRWT